MARHTEGRGDRRARDADERRRYARARDGAERLGARVRFGIVGIASFAAAAVLLLGVLVPLIAGGAIHVGGMALVGLGSAATAAAALMRRSADEPHERIGWLLVTLLFGAFVLARAGVF